MKWIIEHELDGRTLYFRNDDHQSWCSDKSEAYRYSSKEEAEQKAASRRDLVSAVDE